MEYSRSGLPLLPFDSWADVIAYARRGQFMYYKAPLDLHPVRVTVKVSAGRVRKVRVWPPGSHGRGRARTSDPFMADAGHLGRFLRPAK